LLNLILAILMHQLKECPDDFFRDVISQDNFLSDALLILAGNALEARLPLKLSNGLNRLWKLIYDRFRWDIQSQVKMTDLQRENDEYAPVVVE
jgi:A1 cistron-splicing factor AAR2